MIHLAARINKYCEYLQPTQIDHRYIACVYKNHARIPFRPSDIHKFVSTYHKTAMLVTGDK